MNSNRYWNLTPDDRVIPGLERRLERDLYPVDPRPEYVHQLRGRLDRNDGPLEDAFDFFGYLLFLTAGLASSVLLVIAGVKATRSLRSSWLARQQCKSLPGRDTASPLGAL